MIWNLVFVSILGIGSVHSLEDYHQPSRGSSVWGYFTPPVLQRVPPQQPDQSPMDAMVDVTNNLGVAILKDQSYSRGNFAFSPYGVASVLVVLYEGSQGESARQIHRAVGFPSDKDIIRIGFRDIHRHLRSYFSHEGYLSGITLNKEGSSLKPEYKKVLRFYGYDVEMNPSFEDEIDRENVTSTTESGSNVTTGSVLCEDKPKLQNETRCAVETIKSTTQNSVEKNKETIKQELTTVESAENEKNKVEESTTEKPDDKPPGDVSESTQNQETSEKNNNKPNEGVILSLEVEDDEVTTTVSPESQKGENNTEDTQQSNMSMPQEIQNSTLETTTSLTETTVTEMIEESTKTNLDNGMLIPQPDDLEPTTEEVTGKDSAEADFESTTAEMTTQFRRETTTQTFEKSSSQPKGFYLKEKRALLAENVLGARNEIKLSNSTKADNGKFMGRIRKIVDSKVPLWLNGAKTKRESRRKRTITDYLKSPNNPDLSLQLQNGMYDTHVSRNSDLYRSLPRLLFLVDGAVDTPVPMMTYTNVFPYCYIPRLHTKALEFPLDDIRYKLLILLPVERRGLRQLIYDLTDFPLRDILQSLRMQRVKAIVPTFMVEGFVILTSSLQKLGIWDVFDPRKSNLSGMSIDPELYVRNVEQSVTVVIRNYVEILDIQTRTMAARQIEQEFEATHPFLYFVLDTATNVALMAGQMWDPLNSRIY